MGLENTSAVHPLCDHDQTSLSSRAEEVMILQHIVWKHFSERCWDVWMRFTEGKHCSWLEANQL